ncbi:MAG: hypothetical protein Q4C42_11090 [Clostridia bacterium]|nr:hypothetical protein [Clostridia bacterium]
MDNTKLEKINEEALENVSGGIFVAPVDGPYEVDLTDDQGRPVRWRSTDGKNVWHYQCPDCLKPMHEGLFGLLYCDPCDKWYHITKKHVVWDKKEDETVGLVI